MADYQEYRRRILHRRWRRIFITAALLILLVLLAAVGVLWKRLHREPAPNTAQGPTILPITDSFSGWFSAFRTLSRLISSLCASVYFLAIRILTSVISCFSALRIFGRYRLRRRSLPDPL